MFGRKRQEKHKTNITSSIIIEYITVNSMKDEKQKKQSFLQNDIYIVYK